jgi:hypothetical protein
MKKSRQLQKVPGILVPIVQATTITGKQFEGRPSHFVFRAKRGEVIYILGEGDEVMLLSSKKSK